MKERKIKLIRFFYSLNRKIRNFVLDFSSKGWNKRKYNVLCGRF